MSGSSSLVSQGVSGVTVASMVYRMEGIFPTVSNVIAEQWVSCASL